MRALARPCLARKGRPPSGWGFVRTAQRPLGLVDKASDFSSEDRKPESRRGCCSCDAIACAWHAVFWGIISYAHWAHADAREGGRAFGNRACRSRTPGATRARPRSAGHAFASTSKSLAAIMQLGKRQTEDRRAPARSRVSALAYSPCILRGLGRRNATQFVKQEKTRTVRRTADRRGNAQARRRSSVICIRQQRRRGHKFKPSYCAHMFQRGTPCSGITSASHAELPGLKSQFAR